MGSTFISLHYHIIFSTKHRVPSMAPAWRDRLYKYLGGTIVGLKGIPEAIGGVEDHIHLLVGLRATRTLADFVREVKIAGTDWVREEKLDPEFAWQEGYAAFTVSPTARAAVQRYILKQEEHHRRRTFMEELMHLPQKAGITYEAKYLN